MSYPSTLERVESSYTEPIAFPRSLFAFFPAANIPDFSPPIVYSFFFLYLQEVFFYVFDL